MGPNSRKSLLVSLLMRPKTNKDLFIPAARNPIDCVPSCPAIFNMEGPPGCSFINSVIS